LLNTSATDVNASYELPILNSDTLYEIRAVIMEKGEDDFFNKGQVLQYRREIFVDGDLAFLLLLELLVKVQNIYAIFSFRFPVGHRSVFYYFDHKFSNCNWNRCFLLLQETKKRSPVSCYW